MSTKFEVNKLVLGEIARVEDLSGQSVNVLGKEEAPKGLLLAALAYVWRKRAQPDFDWTDALGLTLDEANAILGFDVTEQPADEPPADVPGSVALDPIPEIGPDSDPFPEPTPEPSDS